MKHVKSAIITGVLMSILFIGASLATAQDTWEVVIPKAIEGIKVRMAAFHDENFGVWGGAGDDGAQHYTVDGGKTWVMAKTGGCMFSVDVVDVNTIWQSCLSGTSLTTDGGKNWKVIAKDIGGMASILAFADAKTGWVGSGEKFKMTTDSGATWTDLALPKDAAAVAAISLRTMTDGYLLDKNGTLFITKDGGKSWTSASLGLTDPVIQGFGSGGWINETPEAAVRFTDENNGLVVLGLAGKANMIALRTADGGKSWKEESVPAKPGKPFISRDGRFLTVSKWLEGLTLLKAK
ncbi:MAG: hypothetical protein GX846_03155 [Deltaproteobacteria bacterium]|jgi:photosystem II stability/assembly factor-like uncharacterized protein|nr:hypothetical protein [Deltaproteobacteria bacterium]